jgi:hypothetical protein
MYDKKHYPKGIWTNTEYQRLKISDLSLDYLWNIVIFITRNLPTVEKKDQPFWRRKRLEVLEYLDKLSRQGRYFNGFAKPIHINDIVGLGPEVNW